MEQRAMKKCLTTAHHYSYTRLALNYYMYFEEWAEETNRTSWEEEFFYEFQQVMGAVLSGRTDLPRLEALRQKAMEKMEVLTAYTDCFQVYEHVLNRLELHYVPMKEKYSLPEDEELANEILRFLTSSRDSALMNERIQMVMEQLPIRFTKSKFFSMVQDALSIYQGSPKSSLDAILYVLRTESMVQLPANMKEGHETLYDLLTLLSKADYKNLPQEEFNRLADGLQIASQQILDLSGRLMLEMDLINDLYVIHLTEAGAVMDAAEKKTLQTLLKVLWDNMQQGDTSIPEAETEELLMQLEGKQEHYYERWLRYEIPERPDNRMKEEPEEAELWDNLKKVQLLLSGSSFVELDSVSEDKQEVTRELLEKELHQFFGELEDLWKGMPKAVVRATMARMLSNLPVCFNSVPELELYIKNSLASCTDLDEKTISMELIRTIMVDENEMV